MTRHSHIGISAAAFALIALFALPLGAGTVVQVQPQEIFVGESANLEIISDQASPEIASLPQIDGIQWVAGPLKSKHMTVINGRRSTSYTLAYTFQAERTGEFTFPPIKLDIGGREMESPSVSFTVKERQFRNGDGELLTLQDLYYGKLSVGQEGETPETVYVGQEIPVDLTVFAWESLQPGFNYPRINIENIAVHDYSAVNNANSEFAATSASRQIINGGAYLTVPFHTRIAPLAVGKLQGSISVTAELSIESPAGQGSNGMGRSPLFDDSMFSALLGRGQRVQRTLQLELPHIDVQPLPAPPPEAGSYLGLIGQWDIMFTATPKEVAAGEPLTIEAKISGGGRLETLAPLPLDLPGYRSFEPEVKRSMVGESATAVITWVLIPLREKAAMPVVRVSTFNPRTHTYQPYTFQPDITLLPPREGSVGRAVADGDASPAAIRPAEQTAEKPATLLYIKKELSDYVKLPLWRNALVSAVAMTVAAVFFYVSTALWALWHEQQRLDPAGARRRAALARRRRILADLQKCAPEQRPEVIREQLVPCLSAILGLPPGTTASRLADMIESREPELAATLREADSHGFAPGQNTSRNTQAIAKAASRLGLLLCAALVLCHDPVAAASLPETDHQTATSAEIMAQATAAYDRGEYDQSIGLYETLRRQDAANAALLYNLAGCHYQRGDKAQALALYEQARRLAPRDSDIIGNLNFVRHQFGLPPVHQVQNPRALLVSLRDRFRPDEWLTVAAAILLAGSLVAGWQRLRGKQPTVTAVTAAAFFLLCLLAVHRQTQTTYKPGSAAVIVSNQAVAREFPSDIAGKTDFVLNAGQYVLIEEARTDWCRIRDDGTEGWVQRRYVIPLWTPLETPVPAP
jgi:tetratricopeptide (TPR) repeat protein